MQSLNLAKLLDLAKVIHLVSDGAELWIRIFRIYFIFFLSSFIRKKCCVSTRALWKRNWNAWVVWQWAVQLKSKANNKKKL